MTKTKIFSFLMIPVVVFMGYLLVNSVYSEIKFNEDVKRSEKAVIAHLMMIREAEKAYQRINKTYTADWDSLIDFVKNGELFIIETKEIVTPRDRDDPEFYKGDIVTQKIDTIGTEKVLEKLFPEKEYPNFNPDQLPFIPGTDGKKFDIHVGKVEKGLVMLDVVEVIDNHPLDPTRSEEHPSRVRWPLRFGSKTEVTLSGNWE